jgi:peptidoglycan/xylan/chitin deacetylase (PgdA/CDA1 family)
MTMIPVLMYHQICKVPKEHSEFVVSPETFRRQVEYMAINGYYTPRVSDLLDQNHTITRNSKKPVLITFDDGYLNMFEIAFPILTKFGFSAVVSRSADLSRSSNWWDTEIGFPAAPLMDSAHLIELDKAGIEIASHTMNHIHLPQIAGMRLRYEVAESKCVLENLLGKEVPIFIYPYGETNKEIKLMVEQAGYRCAFAAYTGPINFESDLYEIRRILMRNRFSPAYMASTLRGLSVVKQWAVNKVRNAIRS